MSRTLKIGIAGLGRLGRRHAQTLAWNTRHCEVVAACSPVQAELDAARSELGVQRTTTDFAELVNDRELDALVLVTPTPLHAEQAIAALEAGKHVFVEKPLALDVADCERVQAVARRHPGQVAMVGFVRRFDPSYRSAHAAVQRGEIGRPFLVRSQTCDLHDASGAFLKFAPSSGGIFMDCSVHDVDLARWLLGNPKAVRAFASGTVALHPELEAIGDVDNGVAIVEFDGGARAVFYASRTMAHGHETASEVIGSAGSLTIGVGAARDRVIRRDAHGVGHATLVDFHERFREAFVAEMAHFVAACRGDEAPALEVSDATEATRIGQALMASLRSGTVQSIA